VSAARPTREEFGALAAGHTVVPVWRTLVADLTTPVAAFARVVGDRAGFLLESVEHGERWGRYSFVGRNPLVTVAKRGAAVTIDGELPVPVATGGGILDTLEHLLASLVAPQLPELPPLHSGLMGYLGYDIVREVEHLPAAPADDLQLPDALLSVIGELAVFDHWRQHAVLIANVLVPPGAGAAELDRRYADAVARLESLAADGALPVDEPMLTPPERDVDLPAVHSTVSERDFCLAVEIAKEHIRAGDIFQVVLSQRFDLDLDAEPFDVYRVLRQINPSPYMYFLRYPDVTLVGASPEPLVQLRDGTVISRPIAGTRRRGRTDEEDRRLAAELREHPKEIAEHIMLVDLARNDVGRVVDFGTEKVDELLTLERYSHVFHLTSQVSGRLAAGRTPIDVLRATLPAGTVSGAPKVRAMEIIDALEPTRRGPYAGTVGYLDFSGNIDTAIAIRTMVVAGNRASVQAGAGVVADSVAAHEYQECWNKARALLAAVPAAREMRRQRTAPAAAHAAPDPAAATVVTPVAAALGTGPLVDELALLGTQVGYMRVPRDAVRAEGPDTARFLQGQLSQDVEALAVGQSAWSFLLQPQGKVDAWLRVSRTGPEHFVLDVDAGFGDAVLTRLRRFLVRTKCELTAAEWDFVAVRGPGAGQVDVVASIVDDPGWPGVPGVDLLGERILELQGVPQCSADTFEALRIWAGVPRMGTEIDERTMPGETGLVDRGVSFTKGCYTGQELVARVDSRGNNVPRLLRHLAAAQPVPAGSELRQDQKPVGVVTSAMTVVLGGESRALGYLGRAYRPEAALVATIDGAEIPVLVR
jgi:anthranilate synthase component 1